TECSAPSYSSTKGKVVKWIAHRGFGFIVEVGNSTSYYVRNESLKVPGGAFRALSVGQDVEFDVAKDDGAKGYRCHCTRWCPVEW
ncbi:mitochondrial RNA-binding protein, putative, partial [Bodo saltans]